MYLHECLNYKNTALLYFLQNIQDLPKTLTLGLPKTVLRKIMNELTLKKKSHQEILNNDVYTTWENDKLARSFLAISKLGIKCMVTISIVNVY